MSVDSECISKYMPVLTKYVACEKGIKFVEQTCIEEEAVKPLITEKKRLSKKLDEYNKAIINEMDIRATNVLKLNDYWYAVALVGENGRRFTVVDPINDRDVYIISRDLRTERHLTKRNYDTLRLGILNDVEMKRHEEEIREHANELLLAHTNINVNVKVTDEEFRTEAVIPSSTAVQWWIENQGKIMGVSVKAVLQDTEKVISDIRTALSKASIEFTNSSGLSYFVDKSKLLLFIVRSGVLLELKHYDFGYIPQINRQILAGQIKHVKKLKETVEKEEQKIMAEIEALNFNEQTLDARIAEAQEQLNRLLEQKKENGNKRLQYETDIVSLQRMLAAEVNKVYPPPRVTHLGV